jgi:hypothetical protein
MISPAYRIAAAERAIAYHLAETDPNCDRVACTADDAAELLLSLSLWAECNGVCLRIPKPAYADEVPHEV